MPSSVFGFLLLNTGYYLLQTDGFSKLILNESVIGQVATAAVSIKEVRDDDA